MNRTTRDARQVRAQRRTGGHRSFPSIERAHFLARLIRELAEAWRHPGGRALRDLPEYGRLIEGAHAVGFVTGDIAPRMEYFVPYLDAP
jgi:hypothetical protein